MPLYEYRCHQCGQVFETIQKFSDPPLKTHVTCGGPVERLLSTSAFVFKGTGFYATDYAKKNGSSNINGGNGHSHQSPANGASPKADVAPPAKSAESKLATSSQSAAKS